MKKSEKFFEGKLTEVFTGAKNLYIGDHDFKFANDHFVINAEIKTISRDNKYAGKKQWAKQAREYAATAGLVDRLNRKHMNYLFEFYAYASKPFVIVVPFKAATGNEKSTIDYLNVDAARMLYIDDQFEKLFQLFDLEQIGTRPQYPLKSVNY